MPRVRLEPEQQIVRPGDSPWIRCEVTQVSWGWPSKVTGPYLIGHQGDQPVSVSWAREGAAALPRSVAQRGDTLQFRGIAVSDAGRYVCSAENRAGRAEAVAEVE